MNLGSVSYDTLTLSGPCELVLVVNAVSMCTRYVRWIRY